MTRAVRGRIPGIMAVPLPCVSLVGCRAEENPDPPDPLLRDSLGLTESDRVQRIRLGSRGGVEVVEPSEVELAPGAYAEFFTRDRRVRTVAFLLDSLSVEQAEFLRSSGQDRSPPLVELDSRFLTSFQNAPPGRYPFVVEGSGEPARGALVLLAQPRD